MNGAIQRPNGKSLLVTCQPSFTTASTQDYLIRFKSLQAHCLVISLPVYCCSLREMKNKEEDRQQSQQLLEQKTEELKEYQDELEELNNRTFTLLEEEKGCKEQMAKLR